MKNKWLSALLTTLLGLWLAQGLEADIQQPPYILVASAPTGSCSNGQIDQQVISTGVRYSCQNGTWAVLGPGGGSSSFTALTGDATSTSTGGATTVQGLKSVPFCTGYTPTNGQAVTLTTASSPNPCYTAATPAGAVTSVSNSDGTLTVTPTTGGVVASLALAKANTWTGTQNFNSASINAQLVVGSGGINKINSYSEVLNSAHQVGMTAIAGGGMALYAFQAQPIQFGYRDASDVFNSWGTSINSSGVTTGNVTDSALTSGNCVQASTGGLLASLASGCATTGGANTFSALNTFSNSPGTGAGAYGTLFSGAPNTSSLFNPVVYISGGGTTPTWSTVSPMLAINTPSGYNAGASVFAIYENGTSVFSINASGNALGPQVTGNTLVAGAFLNLGNVGGITPISSGLFELGNAFSTSNGTLKLATVDFGASGTLGTAVFGNATSGTVTVEPQTGALGSQTILLPAASGTVALSIASAQGTPTFTAGTNVTSCGCAAGTTCTNQRGELTIVGGTATTGTICTVNYSATLGTAPGYGEATQNGGATLFGVGHGAPSTTAMTISAGISVATSTLTVDYQLLP